MKNILTLHVETRISLVIIGIMVAIFLVTVLKSLDNFNKFIDKINTYEEIRVETNP